MIRSAPVDLVLDRARLDQILNSQSGPVARHLARVGARVESETKRNLSGRVLSNSTVVNVDTGRLRSGTFNRLFVQNGQLGVAIGVNAHYGRFLAFGTSRGLTERPFLTDAARAVLGPSVI